MGVQARRCHIASGFCGWNHLRHKWTGRCWSTKHRGSGLATVSCYSKLKQVGVKHWINLWQTTAASRRLETGWIFQGGNRKTRNRMNDTTGWKKMMLRALSCLLSTHFGHGLFGRVFCLVSWGEGFNSLTARFEFWLESIWDDKWSEQHKEAHASRISWGTQQGSQEVCSIELLIPWVYSFYP